MLRVFISKANCCIKFINLRQSQNKINNNYIKRLRRGLNYKEVTIRFIVLYLNSLISPVILNIQVKTSTKLTDIIASIDSIISSMEFSIRGFIIY